MSGESPPESARGPEADRLTDSSAVQSKETSPAPPEASPPVSGTSGGGTPPPAAPPKRPGEDGPPRDPCGLAGGCLRSATGAIGYWLSGGTAPPRLPSCGDLGTGCAFAARAARPDLFKLQNRKAEPEPPRPTKEEEDDGKKKERTAERVAAAGKEAASLLFHDGHGTAYAFVRVRGHRECHPIRSRAFERILLRTYYERFGAIPKREALREGLDIIEAWALFDGEGREIHNRVARGPDGAIYYDLSDAAWRSVRITAEGWSIVPEPPVAFRRYSHMAPQVEPVKGGTLSDLLGRLNLSGDDDRLITTGEVVTAMVPDIPHVISNAHGSQGAAKSTGQKQIRRIVDPSGTPCLTMPRDSMEMLQLLDHHYAAIFDNMRDLQPWQSDSLCRASTGDGSSKRELYTDDNDIIRNFRRVIYINGINVAGESPDYLDRSTLHHFERIEKKNRKSEEEIWRDYEAALPRILGAVLDALAGAMRLYPTAKAEIKELPRMADFAIWGEATSRAIGNPPGAFLAAYNRSIAARNREAIEASPVGAAILRLLDVGTEEAPGAMDRWEGTAGDLLRALKPMAEALGVDLRERSWPKSPKSLGKRLRAIRANLADERVRVEFAPGGDRIITVTRAPPKQILLAILAACAAIVGVVDTGKNAQHAQTPKPATGDAGVSGHEAGVSNSPNARETISGVSERATESKRPPNAQEKPVSVEGSGRLGVLGVSAGISGPPSKACPCGVQGEWPGPLCPLCDRDPTRRPRTSRTPPNPGDPDFIGPLMVEQARRAGP